MLKFPPKADQPWAENLPYLSADQALREPCTNSTEKANGKLRRDLPPRYTKIPDTHFCVNPD